MSGTAVDGVIYDSTPLLQRHRAVWSGAHDSADAAIAALDAFRPDVLVPLDFGITVGCLDEGGEGLHDRDRRPDDWYRYLRARDLPAEVDPRPSYRDATVVEVAAVDAHAMRDAVTSVLDQTCAHAPGTELDWTEMCVAAAWLPLPAAARFGARTALVLDDLDGHRLALDVPLTERDGRPGIAGPFGHVGPVPVEVCVQNDQGSLHLRVRVRWSLWWEQDEPGRRAIDDVLSRLALDGWEPR